MVVRRTASCVPGIRAHSIGTRITIWCRLLLIGQCVLLVAPRLEGQTISLVRQEAVEGLVRRNDGTPLAHATVVATAVPSAESEVGETDDEGRVALSFVHGTGNYVVRVSAPGFQTARRRLLRAENTGKDSVLKFTVMLQADSAQVLSVVRVAAPRRQRPSVRESGTQVGGVSPDPIKPLDPFALGDLAALAGTVPGVLTSGADGRNGFSVLGLSPADNVVLLNGLAFGPTEVPASARVDVRLQTSTYDPAVGGFSGGALAVSVSPGSNYGNGSIEGSFETPALQSTDRAGRELGRRFQQFLLGGYRSGALVRDRIYFNGSAQVSRRASDRVTLASAAPALLEDAGTSVGTANRLLGLLDSLGIPAGHETTDPILDDHAVALLRLDLFPSSTRALNAVFTADHRSLDASQLSPLGTATIGGRAQTASLGGQLEYARYLEDFRLLRTRSGITMRSSSADAIAALPAGQVLVTSSPAAAPLLFSRFAFGGSAILPQHDRAWTWQNTVEAAWFSHDNRHQPKITGGMVLQAVTSSSAENSHGTFIFGSLDDLATNHPASFTRRLGPNSWSEHELSGWLSAGDVWRPTSRFSLQYGARAEASRYRDAPWLNPLVDSIFGLRTDALPAGFAVLPRLGFAWSYGSDSRVSLYGPSPMGTIHGGVGAFRSMLDIALPGRSILASGRSGGALELSCVGPAAPVPQWSVYEQSPATIPRNCAGAVSMFSTSRPGIIAFASDYRPSEAWRGNVGWGGSVLNVHATVDALVSLNLHQPGTTDRNLIDAPDFTLGTEGNRPVYVGAQDIDPASGGVGLAASRRSPLAARVVELTSSGRSRSAQLAITLSPIGGLFVSRFWTLGYALTHVEDRVTGFDGGTFGDPRQFGPWSPSWSDVRHTVSGSLAWLFGDAAWFRLNAQLRSGAPFTPRVLGDLNGDGAADDRPFIFDPAHTPDAALAQAMTQLLTSPYARECLRSQLGSAAGRNSCRGPWTTATSAQFSFDGPTVGMTRRVSFVVTASNLLAGLDVGLHGASGARGWDQPRMPDPVLYAVRGFDYGTGAFRYAVNPHFADAGPGQSLYRAPFTVSIQMGLSLGGAYPQQLTEDLLAPGRSRPGERLTADQLASRYARSGIIDPVPMILSARDSLLLSAGQLAAMTALHTRYLAQTDSLWHAFGRELAALGTNYDRSQALRRLHESRSEAYTLVADAARQIRSLLTPDQIARIGPDLLELLSDAAIERLRRNDARSY
jgi:hypothetical protein